MRARWNAPVRKRRQTPCHQRHAFARRGQPPSRVGAGWGGEGAGATGVGVGGQIDLRFCRDRDRERHAHTAVVLQNTMYKILLTAHPPFWFCWHREGISLFCGRHFYPQGRNRCQRSCVGTAISPRRHIEVRPQYFDHRIKGVHPAD